jgi:spore coat polysaccharide biosynthesis protein SpsF
VTLGHIGIIVAARTLSSRLPGKALLPLFGLPMVVFLLRRLHGTEMADVILATTDKPADDRLAAIVLAEGFPVFRGPDADVVSRYVEAAKRFGFETVVRVTADCPFVDAELADWCIEHARNAGTFELATTKGRFPVGLDVEIYRAERMAELDRGSNLNPVDREHLTLYFYNHGEAGTIARIAPPEEWPRTERHFTVDTRADYDNAKALVARMERCDFSIGDMLEVAQ